MIIGINCDGMKDVISLEIGENESSKYWLGVLNSLKNRGVKDVMIICADGLSGIKEALSNWHCLLEDGSGDMLEPFFVCYILSVI